MEDYEKDAVADLLTDCTPLDNYDSLDDWWKDVKKQYPKRKKIAEKQSVKILEDKKIDMAKLKEIADLEKEISDDES